VIPYDQVLTELVLALGAALFLANVVALVRRRADREHAAARNVARNRPGSPVRGYRRDARRDLSQAPLARTLTYMGVGLIVMVWAFASLVA
jgi:hypothetical protein